MSAASESKAIATDGDAAAVLQRLIDAAREAVIVIDREMRITVCNVPAAVAFGRNDLDLEHRPLSEVIADRGLRQAFETAVASKTVADVRLEMPSLGARKFDVHIAPIELGGETHAIGFFYETTQIDRLEVVRQEFLSNISHELRTPLTSILAFVETLEDGALDDTENAAHFLAVIRRNAERMHTLIADILELSLIESGSVSVSTSRIKLHQAAADVINTLSAKAAERSVTIENGVDPAVKVEADVVRLEQMLTNLIDNAIKFNRTDGSVKISHRRAGNFDIISIADTGQGVMPEHLPRIFERFFRADPARSRKVDGTGLGLAIVKHLARLHGGEVNVESAPGAGTTFHISLPWHA